MTTTTRRRAPPSFLAEAATPGTGKTTLAEVVCLAAHGELPISTAWTRDGEEAGKRIASCVIAGRPVLFFDDVARITGDPAHVLSSLITTGAIEVRAMRELASAGGRWDGVLLLTGNNVGLAEEMPRKICRIRLDSPEDPWTRKFRRQDLHAWTLAHRPEIVRAIAVLVRAWQAVGCPSGPHSRPSFTRWAGVTGGILACLGSEVGKAFLDPHDVADMMVFGEGIEELRTLVEAWTRADSQRARGLVAKDLVSLAEGAGVLETVMGEGNDRSRSSRLGHYLKRQRGKVVAGHRIVGRHDPSAGAMRWTLAPVTDGSS